LAVTECVNGLYDFGEEIFLKIALSHFRSKKPKHKKHKHKHKKHKKSDRKSEDRESADKGDKSEKTLEEK
jgi:hypothetical protein